MKMNSQQHLMFVLFFAVSLFAFYHLSSSEIITENTPVQQTAILHDPTTVAEAPAMYPLVPVPSEKPGIRSLVENHAKLMNQVDDNTSLREAALNKAAAALTAQDIALLKTWLFDSSHSNANRSVSLYLLTHAGLRTAGLLYEFITLPVTASKNTDPHSFEAQQQVFESSLRITALEGLDQMAAENPFLAAPLLENIALNNSDPTLRFFADIALSGVNSGRPNKLSRYIDETLKEQGF